MQLSGMLKLKKAVVLHDHVTGNVVKGFEMEFDGAVTLVIEQGSLKDEIERAGGIYVIAALTPSGTIQLKYISFADALSPEELEKRAKEKDEKEMENRKKEREVEAADRVKKNDQTTRDSIRMELSEKKRVEAVKAQEAVVQTNATTAVQGPAVSDEEVEEEFEKRKKTQKSASPEDLSKAFSPVSGDLGTDNEPLPVEDPKSKETKRKKAEK